MTVLDSIRVFADLDPELTKLNLSNKIPDNHTPHDVHLGEYIQIMKRQQADDRLPL